MSLAAQCLRWLVVAGLCVSAVMSQPSAAAGAAAGASSGPLGSSGSSSGYRQRSAPALFLPEDAGDAASAAASSSSSIPSRNLLALGELVLDVSQQPVMSVASINRTLLAGAPRRIVLHLPGGATVTAVRRPDMARLASTALAVPVSREVVSAASATEGGPASAWVGEVVGARGPFSSVVLILAEDGGLYGHVRYLDKRAQRIKAFQIHPLLLDEVQPAVAAAMPDSVLGPAASTGGAASLIDLFPRTHPTKHVILEILEGEGEEPPPEVEAKLVYNGAEPADAKPSVVDTAVPGSGPATVPLQLPSDAADFADAIAAAAGPDIAAQMGPGDFAAAAADWLQRAQSAPAPVLPAEDADGSGGGRRLQQTATFNTRQDILMLYTAAAASRVGGVANIESAIRARVIETNKVYVDSRVRIDLNLMAVRQTTYTGTDLNAALDAMKNGGVSNLSAWREELGADFVQLWIDTSATSGTCGLAWVSASSIATLHGVINKICFSGLTFAHELGHNQGCWHQSSDVTIYQKYAAGYKRCDLASNSFYTVMSYSCSGSSKRVAFISNPELTVSNVPAGTATTGNCARRMTETAAGVAAVRAEKFNSTAAGAIRSRVSSTNKCVDAATYNVGTQVAINGCAASRSHQRWQLLPDGRLTSPGTLRCMDVSPVSTGGVSNVVIGQCGSDNGNNSTGQQWFQDAQGRLHPYNSPARCLTLPNTITTNGSTLTVSTCANGTDQAWNTSTTTVAIFPAAWNPQNSRLQSRLSVSCIENLAFNTSNGAPVAMMPCNTNASTNSNQRWLLDDGQLRLTFNTNMCIEAAGTGANGDVVRLAGCTVGGTNQRFFRDALGRLRPYHATTKCLDIRNGTTSPGAVLQLFDCLGANQQKWTVVA